MSLHCSALDRDPGPAFYTILISVVSTYAMGIELEEGVTCWIFRSGVDSPAFEMAELESRW